MSYGNEESCKIWNRIDLPFQNWHEEFNKFWPEHSKISKNCTLMGWFWPKYIMLQQKSTEELCLIALKIDTKFERKLACASKYWHEDLANFHQSTWKSPNWDFDGILLSKVENVWA